MRTDRQALGRTTFERLIARATQLDEERAERLSVAEGREIARQLGISGAAWDAAVREHRGRPQATRAPLNLASQVEGARSLIVVLGGLSAGAICGNSATGALRGWDALLGAALVVVALGLASYGGTRRSLIVRQWELALWWLAVPLGLTFGLGSPDEDVAWFAINSWVGTAMFGAVTPGLRRILGSVRSGFAQRTT